ncbi:helix-turn-helix protein [Nocardia tenerifensis]|uniref:Helix-turn-helix protein n=1 Tax=Nocardia tenerifensis TaxID=228006 RepID=A0A318K589_9NOCA|nr:helix-turn-helix transcriptional regulator [Nocardia tenerifensis]PXX64270.1 helix-turn-helix protein [Nocardia tenerifensis]
MMTGSTLPRRLLARELRKAREAANVSAEAARTEIGVSKQTLWRMENGIPIRLNPLFVKRLCEVYAVEPELTGILMTLAEEAKSKGWWHAFDGAIPTNFGVFVGLEDAAHRIISYQTTFLPGMLQTQEYRRAMLWIEYPNSPTEDVEATINIAELRQARLRDDANPLTLDVFIDESALRRPCGGPDAMLAQLRHLAATAELPNVSVRIVPTTAGTYRALTVGTFVLLEFPPHPTGYLTEPPVVYAQGFTGDLYLERPEEISAYRKVCTDLKRLALGEAESHTLILDIAEEFKK